MSGLYVRRERLKLQKIKCSAKTTFKKYIREILHIIDRNGEASISESALAIINSLLQDVFLDLATESRMLMMITRKRTLTDRDVQAAVLQRLRGELSRHALAEGHKALTTFQDRIRGR